MKKFLFALAAVAFAGSAVAGPHFMSASASVGSTGALTVAFDEAGLGNGDISYTLNAGGDAIYACYNHGGNRPQASNKVGESALATSGGTFKSKNGRVQGALTIGPPETGTFACPPGQNLVLACVSYTNTVLTDVTNSVAISQADGSITGTFKRTLISSVPGCSTL